MAINLEAPVKDIAPEEDDPLLEGDALLRTRAAIRASDICDERDDGCTDEELLDIARKEFAIVSGGESGELEQVELPSEEG